MLTKLEGLEYVCEFNYEGKNKCLASTLYQKKVMDISPHYVLEENFLVSFCLPNVMHVWQLLPYSSSLPLPPMSLLVC